MAAICLTINPKYLILCIALCSRNDDSIIVLESVSFNLKLCTTYYSYPKNVNGHTCEIPGSRSNEIFQKSVTCHKFTQNWEKKNQNFFLLLSMINLRIMNSQLSNITHIYMFETKNKLNLFQWIIKVIYLSFIRSRNYEWNYSILRFANVYCNFCLYGINGISNDLIDLFVPFLSQVTKQKEKL